MSYASPATIGGGMSEGKRGKMRSVSVRPMYDEKGKISGHTVSADHEPADKPKDGFGGYMQPIESAHETGESAMAKAKEHMDANQEKFGAKGGRSMKDAIGSA